MRLFKGHLVLSKEKNALPFHRGFYVKLNESGCKIVFAKYFIWYKTLQKYCQ